MPIIFWPQTDNVFSKYENTVDKEQKATLALEIGIEKYKQGSFDTATKYLTDCINLSTSINKQNLILKALNNLGNIQADKGDNAVALHNYQSALKIAELQKDYKYIAHINKNIGALFISWKRFEESLNYYYKAEKAALEFRDSVLYADCNNNIGTVLEQQKKYDLALIRYFKALEIYNIYNINDGISMSYSNLAIVYKLKKDYNKAIDYNLKSLELSKKINDKWAAAATLNNIGNLYGEIGNYALTKEYCNQSLKLAQEINAPEITYNIYESLADAAHKAKDYSNAFIYQKQFIAVKDSFNNVVNNKQLSELSIKYETEKKEKENTLLKFENQQKSIETEHTRKQRDFIMLILGITIISVGIIFKLYQKHQAVKQIIKQQELSNKIAFDTEQRERTRIARDLHDSVGQKLSVIKMQLSMCDANKFQEIARTINLLDETVQEIRGISHNLMPPSLDNGLVTAVENMCEELNYSHKNIQFKLTISEDCKEHKLLKVKETVLYRIIQEIINNSLKYAQSKNIHINMDIKNKHLILHLSDNGVGFNVEEKLETNGIGLKNIYERIKQLNGDLQLTSQINIGTTYNIKVPV